MAWSYCERGAPISHAMGAAIGKKKDGD